MSKQTGGPAFPTGIFTDHKGVIVGGSNGLSLRDYFAAKAMVGLLNCYQNPKEFTEDVLAEQSYACADAMLKARK